MSKNKRNVELEIRGIFTISTRARGDETFCSAMCHGESSVVVINLTQLGIHESDLDYAAVYNRYCCKGKRNHVVVK